MKRTRSTALHRFLYVFLAAALLAGGISCAKPSPDTGSQSTKEKNTGTVTNSSTDTGEQSEEELLRPSERNFGDKDYIMLTETNSFYFSLYVYEEEAAPTEFIDIALYARQNLLSERYGVNLKLLNREENALQDLINASSGNTYLCDAVLINAKDSMSAAVSGYLLDINSLPNLNLEASYWDQRIQKEYRIGEMLFQLEGDHTYLDEMRTYIIAYNETVWNDYDIGDTWGTPYELVESGDWTYSNMMLMIRDMGLDLNHDGKLNEQDRFGLVSEKSAPYYFFMGSGMKAVSNQNGTLTLNLLDSTYWQRMVDVLDDLMTIGTSTDVLIANRDGTILDSDKWAAASNVFSFDRTLFRSTSLSAVTRLSDMTSGFGIMPIPAYTKEQDGYYCWVNPYNHQPLAIPATIQDVDYVTAVTEIFAYHSRYGADSLYNAFFDELAYSRLCRKPEDYRMLQLIIDSKTFDIDYAANLTGITRATEKLVNGNTGASASSVITSGRDGAKKTVQDFVTAITANRPNKPNP